MNDLRASIAICTHNPGAVLAKVLSALAAQEGIGEAEILVIDNASMPPVHVEREVPHLRLLREEALGLSIARNRAIAEARADLLLFLDDDAIPEPGWLAAMLRAAYDHPAAAAFGGRVHAACAGALPPWIDERHVPYFGAFDHGPAYARLRHPHFPRGCNMMLRRSMLPDPAPFCPFFGKRGQRQSCFEEIDLCWRLERNGLHSIYVPDAAVRHMMGLERMRKRWFARRVFEQGRAVRMFERRHGIPGAERMLRRPWRAAVAGRGLDSRLARGYLWGGITRIG